jgi:1,4-alpha-glucan branching enzyme
VVVYEIAAMSFQDSNGDGQGDLPGLLHRVEYLNWLGVGAVWLTPIYKSPNHDFGYDIADFCAVDPRFGTLADFDKVVRALHEWGIRLIIDLVPNHTSSSTNGLGKAGPPEAIQRPIGSFGRKPAPTVGPRTIGSAVSGAAPGRGVKSASSSTITLF